MEQAPLRIGIVGLGTVGASVVNLLHNEAGALAHRSPRSLQVVAVSARDAGRSRGLDLTNIQWIDDPVALAVHPDVDVVVELIGGAEGTARAVVEAALAAGKSVITANKSLLAHHGFALAQLAEKNGATLAFEAAVAGGIPIIKALREGGAANTIEKFYGILNGTCNYILTTMKKTRADFADVLAEAQHLGYAESDPSFDIDGTDTAHKLAILSSIAFGTRVDLGAVQCEGIRSVVFEDIQMADSLGYVIKLLGFAEKVGEAVSQRVYPCLVPKNAVIAPVDDVYNAVVFLGDYVGQVMIQGRGAGGNPTASAVVADLLDLANGRASSAFGRKTENLTIAAPVAEESYEGCFYVRLMVLDKAGVVAQIASELSKEGISIKTLTQREQKIQGAVPLVFTTHACREVVMKRVLSHLESSDFLSAKPTMLRIEY